MRKWFIMVFVLCAACFGISAQALDTAYQLYLTQIAAAEAFLQLNKISTARHYLDACDDRFRDIEWDFLDAFLDQSEKTVMSTSGKSINALATSPDGKMLAFGSADSVISLYTQPGLKLIRQLRGHASSVSTIAFSRDGTKLASGGRDHTVIIWDVSSGNIVAQNDTSFMQGIYQVRFHPDDQKVGVVSWERSRETGVMGFLKTLSITDASELNKIETEPHPAAGLSFTKGGGDVIVATWGEIVYSYHLSDGSKNWSYDLSDPEEYNAFHSIALSPDGKTVACGSTDHRIHLLNTDDGSLVHLIEPWEGHTKTIKALAYSPDGRWLASAGEDQTILTWNTEDYTQRLALIGHTQTVSGLIYSNDGSTLYSTSVDGALKEWDLAHPFAQSYEICDFGPWQTPVSRDGKYFAAPCSDKNLGIYEIATGKERVNFGSQSGLCADLSKNNKYLVTSSFDGVVRLWDIASGTQLKAFEGHPGRIDGIAYLNSADRIISVGDTTMRIWSHDSGTPKKIIPLPHSAFRVNVLPDESSVVVGSSDGTISIWSTDDWMQITIMTSENGLNEMAVSPDGRSLAVFSGKYIDVWDLATGTKTYALAGHEQGGYGLGFSPDGMYLISGSYDQTFKLWNLEKKVCTLTYHGYEDVVYSCKIPTSRRLLIGTSQGQMWHFDFK